jgi:hypothetical protein
LIFFLFSFHDLSFAKKQAIKIIFNNPSKKEIHTVNQEITSVESETHQVTVNSVSTGLIRTYVIFLDLPKHLEVRISDLPLMQINDIIEFDFNLKNPRDLTKSWKINGSYRISKRVLKYCSDNSKKSGLTQYLSFLSCPVS